MIAVIAAASVALVLTAAPVVEPALEPYSTADIRSERAGEMVRAVALHYPDDYRALAEAAVTDRGRLIADFFKRRAPGLRNAPPELMIRLNAMQLELIRRLARDDVALCAEFATTAFAGRLDLPDAYQRDASALGALIVEGSKLGEARGGEGQALAKNDAFNWYSQLLREEPSTEFNVAAGRAGERGDVDELECRVGLASLGALARLPPDQAANVGASLLADILADPGRD